MRPLLCNPRSLTGLAALILGILIGNAALAAPLPVFVDGAEALVCADSIVRFGPITGARSAAQTASGAVRLLAYRRFTAAPAATDALLGSDLWLFESSAPGAPEQLEGELRIVDAQLSPDGSEVVIWTTAFEVEVHDLDGGGLLWRVPAAADPSFSDDGRWLYLARGAESAFPGALHLEAVDLQSGEIVRWTTGVDDARPRGLAGNALLFTSGARTGSASYWRVAAAGAEPRLLFAELGLPTSDGQLVVAPSGEEIAWCSRLEGQGELWWADLRTGRVRNLGLGDAPAFAPTGELLCRRPEPRSRDRIVALEPAVEGSERRLLEGLERHRDPLRQPRSDQLDEAQSAPRTPLSPPERAILERIEAAAGPEPALPQDGPDATTFRWPLSYHPGYTSYYDNDAGGGVQDWQCGSFTYNGHRGTDAGAPRWTYTYAGAAGTVTQRCDGFGDGWPGNTDCGGFGNMIKLGHGDANTIYAHFQNGTPTNAASVQCAEYVGRTGTSGNSSGPHLHFEVQRYGYPGDDPFAGACSGPESFWTNQNNGWPTDDCQGGGGAIVIDNEDANFRLVGPPSQWWLANGWGYGGSTRWTYNIPSMPYENAAAWLFDTSAGNYEVQVHIPGNYATTTAARYYVKTSGGWMGPYRVNQNQYYETWVSIGHFNFRSGRNIVAVVDVSGEGYATRMVAADACRVIP